MRQGKRLPVRLAGLLTRSTTISLAFFGTSHGPRRTAREEVAHRGEVHERRRRGVKGALRRVIWQPRPLGPPPRSGLVLGPCGSLPRIPTYSRPLHWLRSLSRNASRCPSSSLRRLFRLWSGRSCPEDICPSLSPPGEPLTRAGRERLSGPPSRCLRRACPSWLTWWVGVHVEDVFLPGPAGLPEVRGGMLRRMRNGLYPSELPCWEINQYLTAEWRILAARLGIATAGLSKDQLVAQLRATAPHYRTELRRII